jgi:hypothetical protein
VSSSNDTQYNGTTDNGRYGGLLIPGIPDKILHPTTSTSDALRMCKIVRITMSQDGQTPVVHNTTPAQNHWSVDKLDADGKPIAKADGSGNEQEDHAGIAQYYERFTLNGWHDGKATIKAEALDAANQEVLLSATADVELMENRAVYGVADLQIPSPPMPPAGSGGSSSSGGETGSGGASNMGGSESGGSASGGSTSEGGSSN